ncbi:MAG TPA: multicopper oxidase domain-containing protein [Mycobacterium sp.]|nr:multicopper oxidase domain-containing protein [Mycobacterium sp.]
MRHEQPGKWISHCHNAYNLGAGMAFFVEYAGFSRLT